MILKKWTIVLLSIIMIAAGSCKKDNEDEEAAARQLEIDIALIEQYIDDNNLNAQSTTSGLYYVILEPGSDEHPNVYSTVTVAYKGYFLDGEVFEENLAFTSRLSNLIPAWIEGIPLIGKGGKIKLILPSALGYGPNGSGDAIPPNTVLVFDITLYDFY
ncbi:MAG: peptidylprolyl isomerase [Bacteroidetes bacterium]|nr:MAG: peptidylprolyl isomerase [Bacteroidota bacterium]RLD48451.1 MAG: peptidylprolyl isomerase [Bacteroidota bacterium]RLD89375.1 MAG: peptidylprolyl isomerase [Bacteroidota bacterium]